MSKPDEDYIEMLKTKQLEVFQPVVKIEADRLERSLRRSRRKELVSDLTLEDWLRTLHAFNWKCAYCGGPFESLDHIDPIVAGGGTTFGNCIPACTTCNKKRDWFRQKEEQIHKVFTQLNPLHRRKRDRFKHTIIVLYNRLKH